MKIKTSELIGAQLDWAVAQTVGIEFVIHSGHPSLVYEFDPEIHCNECSLKEYKCWVYYQPSNDWSQGGPLIDAHKVAIVYHNGPDITPMATTHDRHPVFQIGDTILIAAMRAIVASQLGEEIEVPEELQP